MPTAVKIRLNESSVLVNDSPTILLAASLFYFRIPRELWRSRLEQLKAFGYNSIDVYFPWNFHETSEGHWRFEGDRDAEYFLKLAREVGLWTIARPGPYICSEWDGGALPAYLLAKDGMKLRDNDESYLRYVSRWFDRILPILKRQQAGEDGSVLLVQLENELDFYGCGDPHGYIAALRDMALAHGIDVPLIACAGQGGLYAASGLVDGVVPTCNFYPNDRDPAFEQKVLHYRNVLAERNMPLLVTETNRSHFLLRRLLSAGTKLLGPYLQVSGTDFGFTNGVNNWGNPLSFMTSDYDFGGMISPEGRLRPEAYEGRLLSRLIAAYGSSLAEALPSQESAAPRVTAGLSAAGETAVVSASLALNGGGQFLSLHNVTADCSVESTVEVAGETIRLLLPPGRSVALPADLPLDSWGFPGKLIATSAELFHRESNRQGTTALFHAEDSAAIVLDLKDPGTYAWSARQTDENDDTLVLRIEDSDSGITRLTFAAPVGHVALQITGTAADGRKLSLIVMSRSSALLFDRLDTLGKPLFVQAAVYDDQPEALPIAWRTAPIATAVPTESALSAPLGKADFLERLGTYRGYAWYEGSVGLPAGHRVSGVLVRQASDIVSVYAGGKYAGTAAPAGLSRYYPVNADSDAESLHSVQELDLVIKTEIWGHSNFNDLRLPAMRLDAMKGMTGAVAVFARTDVTGLWKRELAGSDRNDQADPSLDDRLWPIADFGMWVQMERPMTECFRRTVVTAPDTDSWTLHFDGLLGEAEVYANGRYITAVDPFNPFVDLAGYLHAGAANQLTVFLERRLESHAGRAILYEGRTAGNWQLTAIGEAELDLSAASHEPVSQSCELPLRMEPGQCCWLYGVLPAPASTAGWRASITGTGLKLSVFLEDRLISRLWLPGGENRPAMMGGSADSCWFPGPWIPQAGGRMAIYAEAVDADGPCTLEDVQWIKA